MFVAVVEGLLHALALVELEHVVPPDGDEVSSVPPPEVLLELSDGPHGEVGLRDVHDVVPVPVQLQQIPGHTCGRCLTMTMTQLTHAYAASVRGGLERILIPYA